MIQRNQLRCVSCKTDIVTRFGVGHGNKQVHAFPCPKCGVPITCVMRLDQEKGGVAFDPPINADWVDVNTSFPAPVFVTFHPEILEHQSAFQTDGASPFVTAVHHFADYKEFGKHESMRMLVRKKYWETIKRAAVHYERQQWEFWENEVQAALGDQPESSYEGRLKQMFECFDFSVRFFTLERVDIWKTAGEQFADATFRHNKQLTEFLEVLRTSGHLHFAELMDTKMRNGIGHNAAHFDVATDEVVCVKAKGAALTEWRIGYAEFCYAMLELVSAAYFSEAFLREALRRTTGLNP